MFLKQIKFNYQYIVTSVLQIFKYLINDVTYIGVHYYGGYCFFFYNDEVVCFQPWWFKY